MSAIKPKQLSGNKQVTKPFHFQAGVALHHRARVLAAHEGISLTKFLTRAITADVENRERRFRV
jgi:predicted HicB family RNase H-like nuclease